MTKIKYIKRKDKLIGRHFEFIGSKIQHNEMLIFLN